MKTARLALATLLASTFVTFSAHAAPTVADTINPAGTSYVTWAATEVGWTYTPTFAYDLVGIQTKFGSFDGRTVTAELYDRTPSSGGTLLRSANFVVDSLEFIGGLFSALSLDAGEDYFVGFRNVGGLGTNVTNIAGATNLPGGLRYSFANNGSYANGPETGFTAQPMLQFLTVADSNPVPEPGSIALLSLGLIGLAATRKHRQK